MIEANEDLSPDEMKEIIKFTAERKGEPTQPEVDPFWNRDFGWGLIDAYEATKLAIQLKEQNLTGEIDVYNQVHATLPTASNNTSDMDSSMYVITGTAWNQMGSVNAVEYRIDGGEWMSASFNQSETPLGPLERFDWTIGIDLDKLPERDVVIEIRGLSDDGQSLPIMITVQGNGITDSSSMGSNTLILVASSMLVVLILMLLFNSKTEKPLLLIATSDETIEEALEKDYEMALVIDAELVEDKKN